MTENAKRLVRKSIVSIEDTFIEGGRAASVPLRMVVGAAVVHNPWAGQGFVDDLRPEIHALAPILGDLIVPPVIAAAGGRDAVVTYGKAAVVGVDGEVEHASALIHTLRFGNILRDGAEGSSFLPFTNLRAGPGFALSIPMKHKMKEQEGSRAHFLTATVSIPDAPAPDEILVAVAVATGGRPHHRIGDRYQDMRDLGVDQTGARLEQV
ncbi:amino acid synthesis family protein [Limibacillus halophilus]|uniref:Amino acid synthesis n=1 Tax=Limibacillus halophilus TaxID=1579333 RepID=A0A839SU62_9PROT|nr:amino acid synthesis family protein [Limibacillus halophilus]MBB3064515.1 hypothetical protein [Limibacillus halophilus]